MVNIYPELFRICNKSISKDLVSTIDNINSMGINAKLICCGSFNENLSIEINNKITIKYHANIFDVFLKTNGYELHIKFVTNIHIGKYDNVDKYYMDITVKDLPTSKEQTLYNVLSF